MPSSSSGLSPRFDSTQPPPPPTSSPQAHRRPPTPSPPPPPHPHPPRQQPQPWTAPPETLAQALPQPQRDPPAAVLPPVLPSRATHPRPRRLLAVALCRPRTLGFRNLFSGRGAGEGFLLSAVSRSSCSWSPLLASSVERLGGFPCLLKTATDLAVFGASRPSTSPLQAMACLPAGTC